MAKIFLNPQIVECDIENTEETVLMSSGMPPQNTGDWDIATEYTSHNSGSHSVVRFQGYHNGNHSGEELVFHCMMKAPFRIKAVENASGCTIMNVTEKSFTLIRHGHFNGGEKVGFNAEVIVYNGFNARGDECEGAVGITGHIKECDVFVCSLEER